MFRKRSYNIHDEINVARPEKMPLAMQGPPIWTYTICGGRLFS